MPFKVGDLVCTKVRGFPPWPGIIMEPSKVVPMPKKPSQWVYNFGTKDWYWVSITNIELYDPKTFLRSKRLPKGYREKYVEACKAILQVRKMGSNSPFHPDHAEETSEDEPVNKRLSESNPHRTVKKVKKQHADSTSEQLLKISDVLLRKKIKPSQLKFGFLGLSNMGCAIVKNLLHSKHNVTIYDKDFEKIKPFLSIGAKFGESPQDVVSKSDITFSCASDIVKAKGMFLGNGGALMGIKNGKSYVEMTPIDLETTEFLSKHVRSRGGRYLEAQINGDVIEANDGMILILSGGDQALYQDCHSCFKAITKSSFYLGEVGSGCKMSHCLHLLSGIYLAGLFESLHVGDKMGLDMKSVMEVIEGSQLYVEGVADHFERIKSNHDEQIMDRVRHLSLVLSSSDTLSLPIPLGATALEHFKHSLVYGLKRL